MKTITLLLLSMILIVGCSKHRSEDKQVSQTAVEPDNSGRNVRDRDDQTKTAGDQSESEADRTISQNIRQAVTADDSLSTNAKNVKIITNDGTVRLRGFPITIFRSCSPINREPEILHTSNIPRPLKARQQVQVLVESWEEYWVGLWASALWLSPASDHLLPPDRSWPRWRGPVSAPPLAGFRVP